MKNRELVEKLQTLDPEAEVVVYSEAYYECSALTTPDHVQEIAWFPKGTNAIAITKEKHPV